MTKIRVAIIDDHAILRTGLRTLIEAQDDMEVVGEAGSAVAAAELLLAEKPDIVTLDLGLPDGDGISLLRTLRDQIPSTRFLILTMYDELERFQAAVAEGAVGYLVKSAAFQKLLSAIRTIHGGQTYFQVTYERAVTAEPLPEKFTNQAAGNESKPVLTPREREVVSLVALGNTSREIAERLFLSRKTIETYRSKIMEKLGVSRRADLVNYAIEHGLSQANSPAIRAPLGQFSVHSGLDSTR